MENYLVITLMIAVQLVAKRFRVVPTLVTFSAITAEAAMLIDDIAVYYAFIAVVAMALAYTSISILAVSNIKISKCKLVYAILMVIQSILCFLLIPDMGTTYNTIAQYTLTEYNDALWIILILLGGVDCGFFRNFNSTGGANGSNSSTRDNRTN